MGSSINRVRAGVDRALHRHHHFLRRRLCDGGTEEDRDDDCTAVCAESPLQFRIHATAVRAQK